MIKAFKKAWNDKTPYTHGEIFRNSVITLIVYAVFYLGFAVWYNWSSIKEIPSKIKKHFSWDRDFEKEEVKEEVFVD